LHPDGEKEGGGEKREAGGGGDQLCLLAREAHYPEDCTMPT
jgi:hypothetical protein